MGRIGAIGSASIVAALGFLWGCAGGGTPWDPTQVNFAPELGIFLDQMTLLPEGLYVADMAVGEGREAEPGDRVTLHYKGWYPDGTLFDSSLATGEPISFVLGEEKVIEGWELGIPGMMVGSQRILVVPPDLAYGSGGVRGVVPRNATLVFSVSLLEIGEGTAFAGSMDQRIFEGKR